MKIEVLGSGCPTCKKLHQLTEQAVKDLGMNIEVEYSDDIQKILDMGVMSSPVLATDGKPVSVGSVPSIERIKELINGDDAKETNNSSGDCSCGGKC